MDLLSQFNVCLTWTVWEWKQSPWCIHSLPPACCWRNICSSVFFFCFIPFRTRSHRKKEGIDHTIRVPDHKWEQQQIQRIQFEKKKTHHCFTIWLWVDGILTFSLVIRLAMYSLCIFAVQQIRWSFDDWLHQLAAGIFTVGYVIWSVSRWWNCVQSNL